MVNGNQEQIWGELGAERNREQTRPGEVWEKGEELGDGHTHHDHTLLSWPGAVSGLASHFSKRAGVD